MQKGLIGKKIGMTQLFLDNGNVVPVTVVEAGPCVIVQKKTVENDGYEAVQFGYGDVKASRVNKPMKGHFAKNDVAPKKVLREFRFADISALNVGDIIKADTFAVGDKVDVVGTSKGKGTAGASRDGTSAALRNHTVQVPLQDMQVHWVLAPILPEFSKARSLQDISVMSV